MNHNERINLLLSLVENPIRRKIIKRLSQEPSYALELAKEIGVGQQLVTSHLSKMEQEGLVTSNIESSPYGPNRKLYFLKTSSYLTVSFGPHLYSEEIFTFENLPSSLSNDAKNLLNRANTIETCKECKIAPIAKLIADIDRTLEQLENEKKVLLYIRNLTMWQACKELDALERSHDEKRILHFIIDEQTSDVGSISETLNLRESAIREILERLKKEVPLG